MLVGQKEEVAGESDFAEPALQPPLAIRPPSPPSRALPDFKSGGDVCHGFTAACEMPTDGSLGVLLRWIIGSPPAGVIVPAKLQLRSSEAEVAPMLSGELPNPDILHEVGACQFTVQDVAVACCVKDRFMSNSISD